MSLRVSTLNLEDRASYCTDDIRFLYNNEFTIKLFYLLFHFMIMLFCYRDCKVLLRDCCGLYRNNEILLNIKTAHWEERLLKYIMYTKCKEVTGIISKALFNYNTVSENYNFQNHK